MSSKFRIYPSVGIARLGNGSARKDQVVFSPEVPWKNIGMVTGRKLEPAINGVPEIVYVAFNKQGQ